MRYLAEFMGCSRNLLGKTCDTVNLGDVVMRHLTRLVYELHEIVGIRRLRLGSPRNLNHAVIRNLDILDDSVECAYCRIRARDTLLNLVIQMPHGIRRLLAVLRDTAD